MDSSKFGLSLLESLTIGMYTDANVCYREYIQNSCDSINKAVSKGVLTLEDSWVDVVIEPDNRYVSIEDNGMGLCKTDFYRTMANIAASSKKQGEDMGFRGIGRLIGMAFCKQLKFTASFEGEDVKSIFTWDGEKLSKMLEENYDGTLEDAIIMLISHTTEPAEPSERFFKVEMIDVFETSLQLLDDNAVCEYLQFVLPIDYSINFDLGNEIHEYAEKINYHLEEHNVKVNGRDLTKAYYRDLLDKGKPYDRIESIHFHEFRNKNDELLAWMWYGLSSFERQIPEENKIRGLALRSSNIQLGTNTVLQPYFKEERAYTYFVGEVFAVHPHLRPNARRDFFNPHEVLNDFIREVGVYFHGDLRKLFNKANRIKLSYRDINIVEKKEQEHYDKLTGKTARPYLGEKEREKAEKEIELAKEKAVTAMKEIEKADALDPTTPQGKVAINIKKRHGMKKPQSTPVAPTTKEQPQVEIPMVVKPVPSAESEKSENPPSAPMVIAPSVATTAPSEPTNLSPVSPSSLPPKREGISIPTPLPMTSQPEVVEPTAIPVEKEEIKPVYFTDSLSKLNDSEKEIVKQILELTSSVVKPLEVNVIMEKIKQKWN